MLDCHWLKLIISLIILIFNKSELNAPLAVHCTEVLVNTVSLRKLHQARQTWIRISSSWNESFANFAKPANAFLISLQARILATARKVAALHLLKKEKLQELLLLLHLVSLWLHYTSNAHWPSSQAHICQPFLIPFIVLVNKSACQTFW